MVHNSLPPRSMWPNVRSTLKVIDSLADRLDLQVKDVVSVYRSPAYNAKCPGAKSNSFHMRNNAIDIVFPCAPGKVAAMARAMRSSGMFAGGVGRYAGFTHIDTRGTTPTGSRGFLANFTHDSVFVASGNFMNDCSFHGFRNADFD